MACASAPADAGSAIPLLVARCDAAGSPLPVAFPSAANARRLPVAERAERVDGIVLPDLAAVFGGDGAAAAAAAADAAGVGALHDWLGALAAGAHGSRCKAAVAWRPGTAARGQSAPPVAAFEAAFPEAWGVQAGAWAEAHLWQGLLCAEQARAHAPLLHIPPASFRLRCFRAQASSPLQASLRRSPDAE